MQLGADTVYTVDSSQSFYGSLDTAGITVRRGPTSGTIDYTIDYEIKMKGADSRTVASDDSSFVSALSTEERRPSTLKQSRVTPAVSTSRCAHLDWHRPQRHSRVDKEDKPRDVTKRRVV